MNLNEVYNLDYKQIQDNGQNGHNGHNGHTRVNCLTCLYNNIAKITCGFNYY